METQDDRSINPEKRGFFDRARSGRAMAGLIIVGVGSVFLAKQLDIEIPRWIFSWPMIPIVVGLYIGARHSFRNPVWMVPVAIGTVFLLDRFIEFDISIGRLAWPVILICIGLVMIFKPKRKKKHPFGNRWDRNFSHTQTSSEDYMDSVSVFGSLKKNIITKDFKGGEISLVFSGAELNLSQADIQGRITLEITQAFAGTKLIVPPHWKVQTEDLVCIFGGVEDKRAIRHDVVDHDKVLVLNGTCLFGGIDIKSF